MLVRFAYSLVNDEEDIDEEELEQGPNKNFGTFVSHYSMEIQLPLVIKADASLCDMLSCILFV